MLIYASILIATMTDISLKLMEWNAISFRATHDVILNKCLYNCVSGLM